MVNLSAHTKHTLPFDCKNTAQDKLSARGCVRSILMMGKARRVTITATALRPEGAQGAQFSRLLFLRFVKLVLFK